MTRLLFAASLAPFAIAAAPAPSPDLALVQQHFAALDSMTADFTQTSDRGKTVSGTLTLKRPGRIRFQYQQGVPILVVADGAALNFIDYSVKQVQRWPIAKSPLAVLLDRTQDLATWAKVTPSVDPRLVSVDVKDPKHAGLGRISLVFARDAGSPGGLKLQGWVAVDPQSNRTTVRLGNVRYNVPVAANAFAWTDPRRAAHK